MSIFDPEFRPFHMGNHPGQRKALLSAALKHLLEQSDHSMLIETAITQIGIFPVAYLELPLLFRGGDIDSRRRQALCVILTQVGIDDMEGLVATLESIFDERKYHPILLVGRVKKAQI